jgi:hypothetical protein
MSLWNLCHILGCDRWKAIDERRVVLNFITRIELRNLERDLMRGWNEKYIWKMGVYGWRHSPVSCPHTWASLTAAGCITSGAVKQIGGKGVSIKLMAGCSSDLVQSIANVMSRKVNSTTPPLGPVVILHAGKECIMYSNESRSLVS